MRLITNDSLCFRRKPSLGRYSATRGEWRKSYREARIAARVGLKPNPRTSGIAWKAQLVVAFERQGHDPLAYPVQCRLNAHRIINGIRAEENLLSNGGTGP